MNDADDRMKQDREETERKMDAEQKKHKKKGDEKTQDEDTGAHLSPERDIGSQKNATSSSRTPSNEF